MSGDQGRPMTHDHELTRRDLLKGAAFAAAASFGHVGSAGAADTPPVAATAPALPPLLLEHWEHYRGSLGGAWELWRGEKASDNVPWQAVRVPHCVNARDAVDPDSTSYQGPAWYRTLVSPPALPPGGRLLLHFDGCGQRTDLFVHTRKVASHVGGYDEWTADVTDALASVPPAFKGTVPIAVCTDNSRDLERIPSSLSDFNLYGGLYRAVRAVAVPAISVERVHIVSSFGPTGSASLSIRARLYNPTRLSDTLTIRVRILDPLGRELLAKTRTQRPWTGMQQLAELTVDRPELWSPSQTALYRCEVEVESRHGQSSCAERFGLRQVEWVDHGPFKLNGERLLLRGTQRHEDHAGLAAAMTDDLIRTEMRMIKDLGANFIRLGHYQQSRLVLDLCDELGLLVWEEIPWCRGGLGGERYKTQARDMLTALIDQHVNHPSVLLWGLGNENDWPGDFEAFDQQQIRAFMTELNDLAHTLDPSRQTAIRRCDFCKDIVDVYSPSIWAGWYRGRYTEYKSTTEDEVKKVRHFFHAEWGGDSHAGRHSEDPDRIISRISTGQGTDERGLDYLLTGGQDRASRDGDWSETYICNLFDWHLKEQEQMPWLTGAAQWVFKDFSTPLRGDNPIPRMNQKGLVTRDLTPKESYYVFQSYWAPEPMVHIYGHTWPTRWGSEGESKLVKVYSNCEEVELFVNGVSAGTRRRSGQDFPAAGLRWMVGLRAGENALRAVARRGDTRITDEIRVAYQVERWDVPARLALREVARVRPGDAGGRPAAVTVEASLLDAKGVLCLDARAVVRFGLTGDGQLVDNLGTPDGSRVVQLANGLARITLLTGGGRSTLSVSSKGVPTAFVEVG